MAAADMVEMGVIKNIVETQWRTYERILESVGGHQERANLVIAASEASTTHDDTIYYKVVTRKEQIREPVSRTRTYQLQHY